MATFKVKFNEMNNACSRMDSYTAALEKISKRINGVKGQITFPGESWRNVRTYLDDYASSVYSQAGKMRIMSSALSRISRDYKAAETEIKGKKAGISKTGNRSKSGAAVSGGTAAKKSDGPDWGKLISGFVEKGGIVGPAVVAIGKVVTGSDPGKITIDVLKGIEKTIGAGSKIATASGASAKWKTAIGVNNLLKDKTNKGIFNNFKAEWKKTWKEDLSFNKYENGKVVGKKTTAGKIGTVAKWAGYGLTLGGNAYENIQEYGNSITLRGAAETVIETGVDIALGAAVASGVTAVATCGAAAAAGTFLAPVVGSAVVVGAATVGITGGINQLAGGDLGDKVAKGVIGIAEGTGKAVSTGWKKATSAIGEMNKNIGKGVSSAWNNVKVGWKNVLIFAH